MLFKHCVQLFILSLTCVFWPSCAPAATVSDDGGVTLWMSFDNADEPFSVGIDTLVDTDNSGCEPTNDARQNLGAPDSPSSCPNGDDTCTAREKLDGDLDQLAQYIYNSTEGANYLKQVYVEDHGHAWQEVDVRIDLSSGISSAHGSGWDDANGFMNIRRFWRRCIHDVMHHEFGHYFHNLPDRYESDISRGYYRGEIDGDEFDVGVTKGDPNTVMNGNFPHRFVDDTNAELTIEYVPPGETSSIQETLTPALLSDSDPANDGPLRAHHGNSSPFAQDEWSVMPDEHINLANVHTSGDFPTPAANDMPDYQVEYIEGDEARPGAVLLLDRSGSMSVETNGRPASELVQEAGLSLYHSADTDEFVGAQLYNSSVESLFDYQLYDATNDLSDASFRSPTGATNIALALEEGIDALIEEHGADKVDGGRLILMSDGKQTVGGSLQEQVDRARDLGIKVNTLSFGAADAATMDAIASITSGTSQVMAEREDANELKVQLSRFATEIRGFKPVLRHKGKLNRRLIKADGDGEKYEQQFVVPPKSRSMKLYVFADETNAADYAIELVSPTGVVTHHMANSLAYRGRFNGANLPRAQAGVWTYRLLGDKPGHLSRQSHFEILGFVEHRQLDTHVKVTDASRTNAWFKRIDASLSYRYPITDAKVLAYIYVGNRYVGAVNLYDDGQRGGDAYGHDGDYSNVVDLRRFGVDQLLGDLKQKRQNPPKLRFDVRFVVSKRSHPAPAAHYESGTDIEALNKDFELNIKSKQAFSVWDTRYTQVRLFQRKAVASARLLGVRNALVLRPGVTTRVYFEIAGVTPRAGDVRLSFGDDVDFKLHSLKPYSRRTGVRGLALVTPSKFAKRGTRALKLQFGHTRLKAGGNIIVR